MPYNTPATDKHQTILDQFQYQVRRFLGCGGGGFVYLAADIRKKKKRVAVKVVQQSNPLGEGEWRHWLRLRHVNLIQLYEKFEVAGDRYYIMEYASNGTLFEWLKRNKARSGLPAISEQRSRRWVRQLLEAVKYLHAQGLYHFDIKSSNILLDASLNVKLSDFGTMKSLQDENFRHNGCRFYRPPEILGEQTKLRSARSLEGVDMWALGATLLRVFSGGKLISYKDFNQCNSEIKSELLKNIRENLERVISVPLAVEGVRDLVLQLLHPDPRKRPSCSAALRHPWLAPISPTGSPAGKIRHKSSQVQRSLSSGCNIAQEKIVRKPSPRTREIVEALVIKSPDTKHYRHPTARDKERHRRPKTSVMRFPSPDALFPQSLPKGLLDPKKDEVEETKPGVGKLQPTGGLVVGEKVSVKKVAFIPIMEYKIANAPKDQEPPPPKSPEPKRKASVRKESLRRLAPSSSIRITASSRGISRSHLVSRMAHSSQSITPDEPTSPHTLAASSQSKLPAEPNKEKDKDAVVSSSPELNVEKRSIKMANRLLQIT